MKRITSMLLVSAMILPIVACTQSGETPSGNEVTLTGVGKGFGGELTVEVSVDGEDIKKVEVISHGETAGISDPAIAEIPSAIVSANSPDVDIVAGATRTSEAIMFAVKNALNPDEFFIEEEAPKEVVTQSTSGVYRGVGSVVVGSRYHDTVDSEGDAYYYLNQVYANTLFDEDGKILAMQLDQVEMSSPNNKTATSPHFYGFPGQSYNYDENHDGTIDSVITVDEDLFMSAFETVSTKRERGDAYSMTSGSWAKQMDAYQELFVGMTIEEVQEWYETYSSDINGRPLNITDSSDEADVEKFNALTAEEQEFVVDFVSSASISLNDPHGDILSAIVRSWENKQPIEVSSISSHGVGVNTMGRIGPGVDANDVGVYSFNQISAYALFDNDGKIEDVKFTQYEMKSANYTSTYNKVTGIPGQTYTTDVNGDETEFVDVTQTEEMFAEQMADMITKNDLGDEYMMGSGSWADQVAVYEETFVGMTVEEVETWFATHTSDSNGRPLKITDTSSDEDKAKFDALSEEEQEILVDITASATISLNDSHGDFIDALRKAYDNSVAIDIQVK